MRYRIDGPDWDINEHKSGEWVEYSDHVAELAASQRTCKEWGETFDRTHAMLAEQRKLNAQLQVRLAAAEALVRRYLAIDGGSWHVERNARERDELDRDAREALSENGEAAG